LIRENQATFFILSVRYCDKFHSIVVDRQRPVFTQAFGVPPESTI